MKLVFLDIDGVVDTPRGAGALHLWARTSCYRPGPDVGFVLDWYAVENLRLLLERTDARVVITSSWRLNRSVERLRECFSGTGIEDFIIDKLPDAVSGSRGEQIRDYLLRCAERVRAFVILDDIPHGIATHFPDELILCDHRVGFGDPSCLLLAQDRLLLDDESRSCVF